MPPSLRPLPPPSSRRRGLNPDRASRHRVRSYRESDSDEELYNTIVDPHPDTEWVPGQQQDDSTVYPYFRDHLITSPRRRSGRRAEPTITREPLPPSSPYTSLFTPSTITDPPNTTPNYSYSNHPSGGYGSTIASSSSSSSTSDPIFGANAPKITRSSSQYAKSLLFRRTRNITAQIAASSLSAPHRNKKRKRDIPPRPYAPIDFYYPTLDPSEIPPWQHLPYHILHKIFWYAWEMMSLKVSSSGCNVQWMLRVSLLCRSFFQASIGIIWDSPPLYPATKLNRLHWILAQPPENLYTNYAHKVRQLEVRWRHYTANKWQLVELVARLPRLEVINFVETAWDAANRVSYFSDWEGLFKAMDWNGVRLKEWDWNFRAMNVPREISLYDMALHHTRPCLNSLRSLRFSHFSVEVARSLLERISPRRNLPPMQAAFPRCDDPIALLLSATFRHEGFASLPFVFSNLVEAIGQTIGNAVKALPMLERLEFSCCSVLSDYTFFQLPDTITSLTLDSCEGLTSEALSLYFAHRGTSLKELVVTRNPGLSMAFAANLATHCPHLQVFKYGYHSGQPPGMPATSLEDDPSKGSPYGSEYNLSNDGNQPTWPKTLRYIEIDRPGRWGERTAVNVFNSLLNAARDLKDLRVLIIKVILTLEWRQRASFRRKWGPKLEKAFARSCRPPNPNRWSLDRQVIADVNLVASVALEAEVKKGVASGAYSPSVLRNPPFADPPASSETSDLYQPSWWAEAVRMRRKATRDTAYREFLDRHKITHNDILGDHGGDHGGGGDVGFVDPFAASAPFSHPRYPLRSTRSSAAGLTNGRGNGPGERERERGRDRNDDDDKVPYVQGMCDVVNIRMDNMRPVYTETEIADLDNTESEGDEDWNGQDEVDGGTYGW